MNRPRPLLRIPDFGMQPVLLGPGEATAAPAALVLLGLVMLAIAAAGSITVAIWIGSVLRRLLGA